MTAPSTPYLFSGSRSIPASHHGVAKPRSHDLKLQRQRVIWLELQHHRSRQQSVPYEVVVLFLSSLSTMNFAPYQDQSPEIERALSPPPPEGTRAKQATVTSPQSSSPTQFSPPGLPSPSHFGGEDGRGGSHGNTGFGRDTEGGRLSLGAFETSLPMRMDFEAMLAYLLLPPAGGVFLLLVEHKSDYVRYVLRVRWPWNAGPLEIESNLLRSTRFHAWQSSMLFTAIFVSVYDPLSFQVI